MSTVTFFNPYDFRIPVEAIHSFLPNYECSALPKQKGELLEGFSISPSTLASYPKLIITSDTPKETLEENKNIELDFTETKVKTNDK